jgi:hypothetical protein
MKIHISQAGRICVRNLKREIAKKFKLSRPFNGPICVQVYMNRSFLLWRSLWVPLFTITITKCVHCSAAFFIPNWLNRLAKISKVPALTVKAILQTHINLGNKSILCIKTICFMKSGSLACFVRHSTHSPTFRIHLHKLILC